MIEFNTAFITAFVSDSMLINNILPGIIDIYDFGQARKKALNVVDNDTDVAHRVRYSPNKRREYHKLTEGDPTRS